MDVAIQGFHELLESRLVVGHSCGPHDPVALGIVFTNVERKSVLVLSGEVELHFFLHGSVREETSLPELIPHHVVLLAPSVRTVEGQSVVVAVTCITLPLHCHLPGFLQVVIGRGLIAFHTGHLCKSSNTHDGFHG